MKTASSCAPELEVRLPPIRSSQRIAPSINRTGGDAFRGRSRDGQRMVRARYQALRRWRSGHDRSLVKALIWGVQKPEIS